MSDSYTDALRDAERLYCDELWRIEDEIPGEISRQGETRVVAVEVWNLMRAIRLGVGWYIQRELVESRSP